jgi:hypothetical protein
LWSTALSSIGEELPSTLLLLVRRVYSPSPIGRTGLQPFSYWSDGFTALLLLVRRVYRPSPIGQGVIATLLW